MTTQTSSKLTVSEFTISETLTMLLEADQPMTTDEVKRMIAVRTGRNLHITSIYKALATLLERGQISSRTETEDERRIRSLSMPGVRRCAYLYWPGQTVPTRTASVVKVNGKDVPKSVITKKKSRPAHSKNVQTGHEIQNSRPALGAPMQTGNHIAEIDRLTLRVAELELTLEMMRRLLDSTSPI
jgi:DNA-binding PadR family transcriptional regulator